MAEILQEKWMRGVAVTTTVLAVCASIAGSRGGACVAKNQILTAQEGSKWAYYQAKSIKENLAETQERALSVDLVSAASPEARSAIEKEIEAYRSEVGRYEKEKGGIKEDAESTAREGLKVGRMWSQFSLATVFFQIGIMLSSVSALLKRPSMWVTGLVFGAIGLVFLANGFFLLF